MTKVTCLICAGALAFSALIYAEIRRNKTALAAMPTPTWIERYEVDAILRDYTNAVLVLGTGSMRPTIPAGAGVVAYAQLDRRAYVLLGEGDLVVFSHACGYVVHQLAQLDGGSWITSGSANARYDAGRMDAKNYVGLVTKIYLLTPSA